jgi:hypothetical protein
MQYYNIVLLNQVPWKRLVYNWGRWQKKIEDNQTAHAILIILLTLVISDLKKIEDDQTAHAILNYFIRISD